LLDSVALYTLILSNVGWEGELAWGDVEPDGDLDLAVGSYDDPYSAELRVLESSGGALLPVTTIPIYAYFSAFDWLDLDGDGDLELAADSTCEDDADQYLLVFDLQGSVVTELQSDNGCRTAEAMAAGDLDGDGLDDLALATGGYSDGYYPDPEREEVLRSTGSALISGWTGTQNTFSWDIALADHDGDGDLDMAVANGGEFAHVDDGAADHVYTNNGPGVFDLGWSSPEQVQSLSVGWGDRDGDGDLDLAFGGNTFSTTRVYDNAGGTFTLLQELVPPSGVDEAVVALDWADWDGDGDEELAISAPWGAAVYEEAGGSLSMIWSVDLSADGETADLEWLDWDGDGDQDLSVLVWESNSSAALHVFENLSPPPVETGETGETGLVTTGDTAAPVETGDTGSAPVETADTGGAAAETADTGEPKEPAPPGCGCRTSQSPGWALGLLLLIRRRYSRAASAPASTTDAAPATLDQAGSSPKATVPSR
jgi:hypothetical protein